MSGKSICEFPDVCFTPPQTPATPPGVPIPYPNTAMASDTSDGSKSVSIGGQEVMLKNTSFFKKTTGDEAGSAPKKGIITSTTTGKAYFIAWSMDVKIESENAVRHLDMTTHNHGSSTATGLTPTVHAAQQALADVPDGVCKKDAKKVNDHCKGKQDDCPGMLTSPVSEQRAQFERIPGGPSRTERSAAQATADADSSDCAKAMRCLLRPYNAAHENGGCCPGQSAHHIPPQSMLNGTVSGYSHGNALCVCLEGASQHVGSHGENHAALDHLASKPGVLDASGKCTLEKYSSLCAKAVAAQCNCEEKCIEDQLNGSFTQAQRNTKVKHYQSNSKQLSPDVKAKLDAPRVGPTRR